MMLNIMIPATCKTEGFRFDEIVYDIAESSIKFLDMHITKIFYLLRKRKLNNLIIRL